MLVVQPGEHDDRDGGVALGDAVERGDAVGVGQIQVQQHAVRPRPASARARRRPSTAPTPSRCRCRRRRPVPRRAGRRRGRPRPAARTGVASVLRAPTPTVGSGPRSAAMGMHILRTSASNSAHCPCLTVIRQYRGPDRTSDDAAHGLGTRAGRRARRRPWRDRARNSSSLVSWMGRAVTGPLATTANLPVPPTLSWVSARIRRPTDARNDTSVRSMISPGGPLVDQLGQKLLEWWRGGEIDHAVHRQHGDPVPTLDRGRDRIGC